MIKTVFIAAGGKGSRMAEYLNDNSISSKSLIKINNKELIRHIVDEIYEDFDKIVISINTLSTYVKISNMFAKKHKIKVVKNNADGPACFPEEIQKQGLLFLYGHAIVEKNHIRRMLEQYKNNLVVSGYTDSSENQPTVVRTSGTKVIEKFKIKMPYMLMENELYIEPPFIIPAKLLSKVSTANKIYTKNREHYINPLILYAKNNTLKVVKATMPSEIHYAFEIVKLQKYKSKSL